MSRTVAAVLFILCCAPARAWEASASKVEARLAEPRTPARARQASMPGWAEKIRWPEDRVRWSERYGGKTYLFGVGLVRGVENPALRAELAADRARASLVETDSTAVLRGSQILDWYLDESGDMYALAVLAAP